MTTRPQGLAVPAPSFSEHPLAVAIVSPELLIRVSKHHTDEPFFGHKGMNRFDDPHTNEEARYGTCYFGYKLETAIAETLLHDISPTNGIFSISPDDIATRFAIHYKGKLLYLADLTGVALKRMGLDAELTGTSDYTIPQQWSNAIYNHPENVDGFIYMSHHLNTEKAVVLFERATTKVKMDKATPLLSYSGFAKAAKTLGIRSA